MTSLLKKAWAEVALPLLQRPKRVQVAALCYRKTEGGAKEVLLITSRDTGRWILPKGWPIDGLSAGDAAMQEAWEEAGVVKGKLKTEVGVFDYLKRLDGGATAPVDATVFAVQVKELANDYPEADARKRKWVSPQTAAEMVDEPQLKELLRDF